MIYTIILEIDAEVSILLKYFDNSKIDSTSVKLCLLYCIIDFCCMFKG